MTKPSRSSVVRASSAVMPAISGSVRSLEPRLTATRTVPPASTVCPAGGSCVVICPAGTVSLKISS